ncbi:MAG: pirin family protein [Alphaproteobacteria bacterium]|nr:pirin family protein [Alphaproteobacteria bacterium]
MISVQPFERLGRFRNEWLNARHHFSFGHYHDPQRRGIGGLLVWNDDEIAPDTGFDPHPHSNMEIVTYVREGAITHEDSLGNRGRTEAGDVQVMHAGTGIVHAEYNREKTPTRLFQIWILPGRQGVEPGWGTRAFPKDSAGTLTPLADGRPGANGGALPLHADAAVLAGTLRKGETVRETLRPGRAAYLVPATGAVSVNGVAVNTRDGATITGETELTITATEDSEVVLVDVVG